MSIDEYYEKRKREYIEEAKAYALEIYLKTGQIPKQEDFWEEFPLFLKRNGDWGKLPVKGQLRSALAKFLKSEPIYDYYEAFLIDAGIPKEKVEKR